MLFADTDNSFGNIIGGNCDPSSWCGDDFEIWAFLAVMVFIFITAIFAKWKKVSAELKKAHDLSMTSAERMRKEHGE